jgi:hypothetical protein
MSTCPGQPRFLERVPFIKSSRHGSLKTNTGTEKESRPNFGFSGNYR